MAPLRLRHRFTQFPHRLRLRQRGRDASRPRWCPRRGLAAMSRRAARQAPARGSASCSSISTYQRRPGPADWRRPAMCCTVSSTRDARHQLEGGELVAARGAQLRQQLERMARGVDADQRGGGVGAAAETASSDAAVITPERAFGADEQRFDVVAGVVLAQALEPRQHAAVRQHHLQAEHQVAHHAVAQHRRAAGIGGQIAADLAAALRTQAQGKQPLVPRPPRPAPRPACSRPRRSSSIARHPSPYAVQAPQSTARSGVPDSSGVAPPQ